jgi:hypothetical protein
MSIIEHIGLIGSFRPIMQRLASILLIGLMSLSCLNLVKAKYTVDVKTPETLVINKGKCKCPQPDGTKGCCNDDIQYLALDQTFTSESPVLVKAQAIIIQSFFVHLDLFKTDRAHLGFKQYKPPLPDKDIPVLIQSFLI